MVAKMTISAQSGTPLNPKSKLLTLIIMGVPLLLVARSILLLVRMQKEIAIMPRMLLRSMNRVTLLTA